MAGTPVLSVAMTAPNPAAFLLIPSSSVTAAVSSLRRQCNSLHVPEDMLPATIAARDWRESSAKNSCVPGAYRANTVVEIALLNEVVEFGTSMNHNALPFQ